MHVLMYADVTGSAALYAQLKAEEADHASERCLKRMTRAIEGQQGKIVDLAGDELLAIFTQAEAACRAAVELQERIADLPPVAGLRLAARVGLHAGPVDPESGRVAPRTTANTARMAGMAREREILASSTLLGLLPRGSGVRTQPASDSGEWRESGQLLAVHRILWGERTPAPAEAPPRMPGDGEPLCLRYHGQVFLLDTRAPTLTLGRDPHNMVVVTDRKASRHHARIERRAEGDYLVDTSTNGSFVTLDGQQEILLRQHEMRLSGRGRICFGSSANDPSADFVDFAPL